MLWVILSIFSVMLWAAVNLIDKYILSRYLREPMICIIVVGFIGLAFSVAIFIKEFIWLSLNDLIVVFSAGFVYVAMTICYFKALKLEEVSRVSPLFELKSIFVLVLAPVFLGEILTPMKYLGVVLLVSGSIMLSVKEDFSLRNKKAFFLMVMSAFFLAIYYILTKYLLSSSDYLTVFAYIRAASFLFILPIIYLYLPELKATVQLHGKKVVGYITFSESLNFVALLSFTAAMSYEFVTLVGAIGSMQPLFVLVFALLVSVFYPKILKEETRGSIIVLKLLAVALIITGAIIIV